MCTHELFEGMPLAVFSSSFLKTVVMVPNGFIPVHRRGISNDSCIP